MTARLYHSGIHLLCFLKICKALELTNTLEAELRDTEKNDDE